MKTILSTVFIGTLLVFSLNKVNAQDGSTLGVTSYEIGIPLSSFSNNYVNKVSFNGGNIEARTFLSDNISVGASFSWQKYYAKQPRQTYQIDGGAITATQYHWLRQIPLKVTAHYYLGKNGSKLRPYLGVGTGLVSIVQETTISDYTFRSSKWSYILAPEIGALISFREYSSSGLILGAKYNYTTYSEDNVADLQNVSFHAGLYFFFD